jgi:hypothetical protein
VTPLGKWRLSALGTVALYLLDCAEISAQTGAWSIPVAFMGGLVLGATLWSLRP